jgi:hypothetical protein
LIGRGYPKGTTPILPRTAQRKATDRICATAQCSLPATLSEACRSHAIKLIRIAKCPDLGRIVAMRADPVLPTGATSGGHSGYIRTGPNVSSLPFRFNPRFSTLK